MIDTIHAYLELPPGSVNVVDWRDYYAVQHLTSGHEVWILKQGLFYLALRRSDVDMLKIEVSIPYVMNLRYENVTMDHVYQALAIIDSHIADWSTMPLPPLDRWTVTRIDYAYNFHDVDVTEYMVMLHQLTAPAMQRDTYEAGVMWRNKSRAVKFYDKALQMGMGDERSVLRYEVSNHAAAVRYMCKHWFKCERTVAELVKPERALYVLKLYWSGLKLDDPATYKAVDVTLLRLKRAFGSSFLAAQTALQLISTYGRDSYRLELLSYQQYNAWKKKLHKHSFLPTCSETLSELQFPPQNDSQNLAFEGTLGAKDGRKNLPENEVVP